MRQRHLAGLILAATLGLGSTADAQSSNASNMGTCSRAFAELGLRPLFNSFMRDIAKRHGVPLGAVVSYLAHGDGNCRD